MVGEETTPPKVVTCDDLSDPERLAALVESGLDAQADQEMEWFADRVRHWLGVPVALVSLVRSDEQVFPGAAGLGEPWATRRRTPLTHSFCQHVVLTGRPLIIEDARDDPTVADNMAIPDLGVVAYAGMPVTDESGHVLGSLCAIDRVARSWTTVELDALSDLAVACSAQLRLRLARVDADRERARRDRLELSLRESFERSQTLLEVSRSVGDNTSVEDLGASLADVGGGVLGADYVALLIVEGDHLRLVDAPGFTRADPGLVRSSIPLDQSAPSTRAVNERRIVVCSSRAEFDATFSPDARERLDSLGVRAVVAAPVLDGRGVVGALVLGWHEPRDFSPAELLLVNTAAAYTARAVDHVGWVQHRVSVAREMQQAMLTDLPEIAGLELAARYEPADAREHVGGDWYDASPLHDPDRPQDTVVTVSVGDIVGHELTAATTMGQVRSMLRQAAWDRVSGPPSATMHAFETANAGVGLDAAGTVVLAYLRRDPDGRWSVSWVNAGHPLPILVHPDGSTQLLEGHGRWFGLPRRRVEPRRHRTLPVPTGSTLVLYTDGMIERHGSDPDDRVEELRRLVGAHARSGIHTVVDVVMTEMGHGATDDIVALAARLT